MLGCELPWRPGSSPVTRADCATFTSDESATSSSEISMCLRSPESFAARVAVAGARRRRGLARAAAHPRDSDLDRLTVGLAGDRHQPALGLDDEVVPGPCVAEAGDRAADEPGTFLRESLIADAEALRRPGAGGRFGG